MISIHSRLVYGADGQCDLLLQIEAAASDGQVLIHEELAVGEGHLRRAVPGEEAIGQRRWIAVDGRFVCDYRAEVHVTRPDVAFDGLVSVPRDHLPGDVIKFLMPSRYCHPEAFFDVVPTQFGGLRGGALIARMAAWIAAAFTYDNGISHAGTTATDTMAARAGVCRDFAHVLIAMARAVGIPARIVSCYAPGVTPPDFHATVEVFLSGGWHLVDPTGMATAAEIVRIGVGRDAADVSFMTSYGFMTLQEQRVTVTRNR